MGMANRLKRFQEKLAQFQRQRERLAITTLAFCTTLALFLPQIKLAPEVSSYFVSKFLAAQSPSVAFAWNIALSATQFAIVALIGTLLGFRVMRVKAERSRLRDKIIYLLAADSNLASDIQTISLKLARRNRGVLTPYV